MVIACLITAFAVYFILYSRGEKFLAYPTMDKIIFFRDYVLLTALPYIYYSNFSSYEDHYILASLRDTNSIDVAAISALSCIAGFLVSFRSAEPTLRVIISKFRLRISSRIMLLQCAFLSAACLVFVVFFSITQRAGFYGLLSLNATEIVEQRALLTQSGGAHVAAKMLIKSWIPSLGYLYFFLLLKETRPIHKGDLVGVTLAVVSGVFASIMYFEKSGLFFYIVGFFGIWIYSGRRLRMRYMLFAPVLALLLTSLMYVLTYQGKVTNFEYVLNIIEHRVMSQGVGSIMAFDYFSDREFLGVSGISNFLAQLTNSEFRTTYSILIDYYVPETTDVSGALSSFAVGDAFGLFGWVGVALSGIVMGVFFAALTATSASFAVAVIFCGSFGVYYSHFVVASTFYGFLWPVGLIYACAPFLLMAVISHLSLSRGAR